MSGVLAIGLLWSLFLLEFEIPLMLALGLSAVAFAAAVLSRPFVDRLAILVLANWFYWITSGLATDALRVKDLASAAFLEGDGRILVAWFPLLLFAAYPAVLRDIGLVRRNLLAIAAASIALFFLWTVTHAGILSEGGAGNYVGFLTSHTGAGTFFGAVGVFLVLYGYEAGRWHCQVLGWLMILPVAGSASREALLAILAVGGWYMLRSGQWRLALASLAMLTLLVASIPLTAPHTWERTSSLFVDANFEDVAEQVMRSEWEPGVGEVDIEGKQRNVLSRLAYWRYALKRFSQSPLIGIGFGRYNDYQVELSGAEGLVAVALDGTRVLAPSSAHNSYFHVLCESGLLGLAGLLAVWAVAYRRLGRGARALAAAPEARALAVAAQGLIVFALVAALVGHALAAPSVMIPVTTLVGLTLAYHRQLAGAFVIAPHLAGARPGTARANV
jgi:O-antigen ligase